VDNEEFWVRVWKIVMPCLLCLVAIVASCVQVSNYQARKVLEAGVAAGKSPLEIKCAWQGSDTANSCLLLYAKP
jgi:hypothetical protein